ncbi:MAG: BON domain-containing protein [Actinomycetota bacterium]|nr:BON domain-containing protein [Actinomycetota bacterium]
MITLLSIAERTLGVVAGAASAGLRAVGQVVTAARGGHESDPATPPPKSQLVDAALARKVESELFRDGSVPKGNIDVNAVGRVVYLRGKARSAAMVADLSVRAQAIPEVERVENLLGTAQIRRSKGTRGKGASPPRRRRTTRRVNAEAASTDPKAEPTPRELAAKGQGRRAAPLGSTDGEANVEKTPPARRPKAGAAKGGAKSGGAKGASSTRGSTRRVNAEVPSTDPKAEPTPREMAAKGEGRRAAPLGSTDSEAKGVEDTTPAAPTPGEDVGS